MDMMIVHRHSYPDMYKRLYVRSLLLSIHSLIAKYSLYVYKFCLGMISGKHMMID
jgi:hypothetical protein